MQLTKIFFFHIINERLHNEHIALLTKDATQPIKLNKMSTENE